MIRCTYNERFGIYDVYYEELNKYFRCDKDGNLWHERSNYCQITTRVETKDIPPIVLIKAFEYWNKPVEVRPDWLLFGNYPQEFLDSLDDAWLFKYIKGDNPQSSKILPIGVYNISTKEEGLINCLNFNLEDKGCINVIVGDLENVCKTLNNKTKELLSDYTQPYNHSYILIEGGPLGGKCFIPSKKLIVSQYDCSILNLPKNDGVLEFNNDDGYEYWNLIVKYFEDYFQDGIILLSTSGDWDIEYLPDSNKYHLIEKNNWYKTENTVGTGTLDECIDAQDLHKKAYQKGKEAGKKLLANSIINTCENLVL